VDTANASPTTVGRFRMEIRKHLEKTINNYLCSLS
jgi:hypothetical protein